MPKFSWPNYPSNDVEFEALMNAIDNALAAESKKISQRSSHIGFKFWEAFGWGGSFLPSDSLADEPGYEGDILMAKGQRWYKEKFGSRLNVEIVLGYVPAKLGNAIWRVTLNEWMGTVEFYADRNLEEQEPFSFTTQSMPKINVLTSIDNLTQKYADSLSDHEITQYFEFHMLAVESIQWRNSLPNTGLLEMSKDDYNSATVELLADRFPQARWAIQQCIEKLFKSLLEMDGHSYKRNHDLEELRKELSSKCNIEIEKEIVEYAFCSPSARYKEELSTQDQAFQANISALKIYDTLRKSKSANSIINAFKPR